MPVAGPDYDSTKQLWRKLSRAACLAQGSAFPIRSASYYQIHRLIKLLVDFCRVFWYNRCCCYLLSETRSFAELQVLQLGECFVSRQALLSENLVSGALGGRVAVWDSGFPNPGGAWVVASGNDQALAWHWADQGQVWPGSRPSPWAASARHGPALAGMTVHCHSREKPDLVKTGAAIHCLAPPWRRSLRAGALCGWRLGCLARDGRPVQREGE